MTKKQMQEVMNEMALEIYRLKCEKFFTDEVLKFLMNIVHKIGLFNEKELKGAFEKIGSNCKKAMLKSMK